MPRRDDNWVDGLRGLASFIVVCGHLCTSFAPYLQAPAPGPDETPHLFQRPILRIVVGGRTAVALFFIMTGYVNAVGPMSRAHLGELDEGFVRISRSCLARPGRLMLPTMFATFFSWLVANVNGYKFIEHVDATWVRQGYWPASGNLGAAVRDLVYYCVETWTTGWNGYDGTHWTMVILLEAAMMVYMTMAATMCVTPRARRLVLVLLYVYGWMGSSKGLDGNVKTMNVALGMIVADMHVTLGRRATEKVPRAATFLMALLGIFLASFPQDAPEWALWSRRMATVMEALTHKDTDIRRHWDSLGASAIFVAVFLSAPLRALFTSRVFNFLGRVSFPVYLIHNTLIKTVLAWMLYMPSYLRPRFDENGNRLDLEAPGRIHMAVAIAVFYLILYRLALLWTCTIDVLVQRWIEAGMRWAQGLPPEPEERSLLAPAK